MRGRRRFIVLGVAIATLVVLAVAPAMAVWTNAALGNSAFEIDEDANLRNDGGSGYTDWADLAHPDGPELRATDLATGQNDDSYKGGTKEDTVCPDETTGSIPNNKSDLLTFHVYQEPGGAPGDPGYLNLAWSRVSDPSGTTLMDFEFNQSTTPCDQGPNVLRTVGDLLIEYAIDQGGSRAEITGRFWDGTEWGAPIDLDDGTGCNGGPCAVGTINQTAIPDNESDGLGEKQAYTFGEAQIDLDLIFSAGKCTSFGSAMLKSRSSDSFTSQLKDFIAPIPIDIGNCGSVIIRKQTDPDGATETFPFTKSFTTDPATGNGFSLADDGVQQYDGTVLFGTGYTVSEGALPSGWDFDRVDCSASSGVTPSIDGKTVTFAIDSEQDTLDCTYYNEARGTLIVTKVSEVHSGTFGFTSATLTPGSFDLTTVDVDGTYTASRTFSDLVPGTFDVSETEPAGWDLKSATCDDGSDPASIGIGAGETVECTFVNTPERGAILITKTRKHAAALNPLTDPHQGVTFTVTGNGVDQSVVTGGDGTVCVDGLIVSSLAGGDYTVTETVPNGYVADSPGGTRTVTVTKSTCTSGAASATFSNTPKTDVSIGIDSQVDGGTSTVVECWEGTDISGDADYSMTTDPDPTDNGDGTLSIPDLLPTDPNVTLTCTITVDP